MQIKLKIVQIKETKSVRGRAHHEFHLVKALKKSKYVELMIYFQSKILKTEEIKRNTEKFK